MCNMFFISQLGSVLTSFVIILVENLAVNVTAQICAIVWQPHVKIENGPLPYDWKYRNTVRTKQGTLIWTARSKAEL